MIEIVESVNQEIKHELSHTKLESLFYHIKIKKKLDWFMGGINPSGPPSHNIIQCVFRDGTDFTFRIKKSMADYLWINHCYIVKIKMEGTIACIIKILCNTTKGAYYREDLRKWIS